MSCHCISGSANARAKDKAWAYVRKQQLCRAQVKHLSILRSNNNTPIPTCSQAPEDVHAVCAEQESQMFNKIEPEIRATRIVLASNITDHQRRRILYYAMRVAQVPACQTIGIQSKKGRGIMQLCSQQNHTTDMSQRDQIG